MADGRSPRSGSTVGATWPCSASSPWALISRSLLIHEGLLRAQGPLVRWGISQALGEQILLLLKRATAPRTPK